MLGDQRRQHVTAPGFENGERAHLIFRHEAAIAHYIGRKDGRKAALGAFLSHGMRLPLGRRRPRLYWCAVAESIGSDSTKGQVGWWPFAASPAPVLCRGNC